MISGYICGWELLRDIDIYITYYNIYSAWFDNNVYSSLSLIQSYSGVSGRHKEKIYLTLLVSYYNFLWVASLFGVCGWLSIYLIMCDSQTFLGLTHLTKCKMTQKIYLIFGIFGWKLISKIHINLLLLYSLVLLR